MSKHAKIGVESSGVKDKAIGLCDACPLASNKQKFPLTAAAMGGNITSKLKFYEADRVIIVTTPSSKLN